MPPPPTITDDDGFEITLSHQNEWPTSYDSVNVSDGTQREASNTTAHVGNFTGILNKTIVQREISDELLMIQLFINRDFDFFSGNAVQFGLHVVTADGGDKQQVPLDPILRATHERRPKDPTGFTWFAVEKSKAAGGTVWISVTRGNEDDETGVFTELSGEAGKPYIVGIEWRSVRRGRRCTLIESSTSSPVSRQLPAKTTKPRAKKSIEQSGGSSSADKSTEQTRAESVSEQVSTGNNDNDIESNVEPTAVSKEQAAGGASSAKEASLPIRLKNEDSQADLSQSRNASGSNGAEVFTTPPATFADSDRRPDLNSGTGGAPEGSVVGPTPTLADEIDDIGTATRKRSRAEAFGPDHESESENEKDMVHLIHKVDLAKADLDVHDARVQEMTEKSSQRYFGLLLEKAKSYHAVAQAELELKKDQLEGKKDAEYRELKTHKAEAHLAVLEAQERISAKEHSLAFKVEKAQAEFGVARAKVKQMVHEGCKDDVEYLQALLKRAQANSGVALAEFELKVAECGVNKDAEYFQLQTRKAEAHRDPVRAQGTLLRKTRLQR